jgi:DNA-binding NarL/FixJ family response regulator
MTTALVCDERRTVRELLLSMVSPVASVDSVESVASGDELLSRYGREPADVVLIGTQRALTTGVETVRQLLTAHPDAAVIVFGSPDDTPSITAAIAAGARGFLRWDATTPELLLARSDTMVSGTPQVARLGSDGGPSLTDRELQVLQGMSRGRSNGEIGEELFLSEDTIKTHARRLFKKLGARDRAHAVAVGFRHGFVA